MKESKKITPCQLSDKMAKNVEVSCTYDWKKQSAIYKGCKWGTNSMTNSSTCSGQFNFRDDSNSDSYTD